MSLDPESLRAGDVVFIRIDNFLYRRVAASTRSWISHVGILYESPELLPVVAGTARSSASSSSG